MIRRQDVLVTVGDSITDAFTYQQVIRQSLVEAGRTGPTIVCAGTVSDTAENIRDRFRGAALDLAPTVVTLLVGANDALRGVTVEEYGRNVRAIIEMCQDAGVRTVLVTPCVLNQVEQDDHGHNRLVRRDGRDLPRGEEETVRRFIEVIDELAAEFDLPVARNYEIQAAARSQGRSVISCDGVHPNYLGQSLIARSLMDALGWDEVPLTEAFRPPLLPGVITQWKMRPRPDGGSAAPWGLDDSWADYDVVASRPRAETAEDFFEQLRRNGYGFAEEVCPGAKAKQAIATVHRDSAGPAWVSVSMFVASVHVNGERVSHPAMDDLARPRIQPVHVGGLRFPVQMRAGANVIAVEVSGDEFCVLVSDELLWERAM